MMVVQALLLLAVAMSGGRDGRPGDVTLAGGQQSTKTFTISIDGSAGVRVVAGCLVDWGDDADVVTLKGEVPLTRKVEAHGLACQIKKLGQGGRLVIEIRKNGRVVSRSASTGSSSVVSISVQ